MHPIALDRCVANPWSQSFLCRPHLSYSSGMEKKKKSRPMMETKFRRVAAVLAIPETNL